MRVLVTGGAGYIGSHTAKALARAGFEPVVLDHLSTGHEKNAPWGPLVRLDVAETDAVRAVLQEYRIAAVIHFAASICVGESVERPLAYFRNNIGGSLSLLEAMLSAGVNRIVFSSTAAVYGMPTHTPIPEDHFLRPVNPYGESKRCVEEMLRWLGNAHHLSWVALRYFNAAGADLEGELGEEHQPETHLIPLVIAAAMGERESVEIYGADYPTPDGTAIRDYVHVADLADAHVRALRYLLTDRESVAVNVGTGRGSSVREVIAAVERASGRKVPAREAPRRAGDPPVLVAASHRAKSLWGWRPVHSDLKTIVQTAWSWHARKLERESVVAASAER